MDTSAPDALSWIDESLPPPPPLRGTVGVLLDEVVAIPVAPPRTVAAAIRSLWPSGFAEWFVVAQTAIPALLFLPGSQAVRLPIRIGAYATALAGLALWWLRGQPLVEKHPVHGWLRLCALWLALMLTHPLTNSLAGGVGQMVLYLAVFCAAFWAPSMVERRDGLVRILALLLVCNGLNATVGVLQVYDPERWMPRELSFAFTGNRDALAAATYIGAHGRAIVRPPGLFDTPGAVCGPGTVAALLGLIFALEPIRVVEARRRTDAVRHRAGRDLSESRTRQLRHHARHDGGVRRAARRAAAAQAGDRVRHVLCGGACRRVRRLVAARR